MTEFELGIMTQRWRVTAPDIDTAVVALMIKIQSPLPIAAFNTDKQSKFMFVGMDNRQAEIDAFVKSHTEELKAAIQTVKKEDD